MTILLVIIFLSLLVFVHELGHFFAAKFFGMKVQEFGFGFPPRLFSKKIGETTYSFNLLPFGGFVRILGEHSEETKTIPQDISRSFSAQPLWQRAIVICSGAAMNFVFGWALLSIVFFTGTPQHVLIYETLNGSPAETAGFQINDLVLNVRTPYERITPKNAEEFQRIINSFPDTPLAFTVQRGAEKITITASPQINEEGNTVLGVRIGDAGIAAMPFYKSILIGLKTSATISYEILRAFGTLIKNIIAGNGISNVAGPVAIVNLAVGAQQLGTTYFLQLIALISLNLMVINIIPFPALDGGRLLFLFAEKIKRGSLPPSFERIVNGIGIALLLLLMIFVTAQDVSRLF